MFVGGLVEGGGVESGRVLGELCILSLGFEIRHWELGIGNWKWRIGNWKLRIEN